MAELALTALVAGGADAAVGLTAAETATAVAAGGAEAGTWAAGTTVTSAAGGAGFLSSLQGLTTIGSQISSLFSGVAGFGNANAQAGGADLNARASQLQSEQEALAIQREYIRSVGANRVAFAASGQDVSAGSDIEGSLASQSSFNQRLARSGGLAKAAGYNNQADALRTQGYAALATGIGKAGATGADYALDLRKRA